MSIQSLISGNEALKDMFQTIPAHILERCFVKHIPEHTQFLNKDEEIENIYFVCEGSIRVISEFINGTIHGFAYVEPGDVIGAMELLSEHWTSACTLETLTDCKVITMSVMDFLDWFEADHDFAKGIARMVARKFFPTSYDYGVVFKEEAVITVGRYLYKWVMGLGHEADEIAIEMTRQYLAEELGISTRTVYRALRKLADQRYVEIREGVIYLSDQQVAKLGAWLEKGQL